MPRHQRVRSALITESDSPDTLSAGSPGEEQMKHRLLVGAGVAATAVLVTPWSAAAATSASPPASAAPHATASATPSAAMSSRAPEAGKPAREQRSSTTQADPVVDGCNFTQTATTWTL